MEDIICDDNHSNNINNTNYMTSNENEKSERYTCVSFKR